jgi:acyl-CoA synthetase (AMP-forming)/AMP-acid ligase II
MDGIQSAACIFDNDKKKIIMYYVGDVTKADAVNYCREKLPRYMVPNLVEKLDVMPLTSNGKINRLALKEMYANR